jgi:hypothetical protein
MKLIDIKIPNKKLAKEPRANTNFKPCLAPIPEDRVIISSKDAAPRPPIRRDPGVDTTPRIPVRSSD